MLNESQSTIAENSGHDVAMALLDPKLPKTWPSEMPIFSYLHVPARRPRESRDVAVRATARRFYGHAATFPL